MLSAQPYQLSQHEALKQSRVFNMSVHWVQQFKPDVVKHNNNIIYIMWQMPWQLIGVFSCINMIITPGGFSRY